MDKVTTADRLKEIMSIRKLKQVDILEKCQPYCAKYDEKINKSHLSQWIAGINSPNQRKLTILSLALGVQEAWLMGYDVPMYKETMPANLKEAPIDALIAKAVSEMTNDKKKLVLEIVELCSQASSEKIEAIKILLETSVGGSQNV